MTRRFWLACTFLALMFGCATHQRKPTDFLIEPPDAATLGYRTIWLANVAVPSDQRMTVLTAADTSVYIATAPDNLVSAISMTDGSLQWRQLIGEPSDRILALIPYQKQLLVCTETRIFTLDRNKGTIDSHSDLEITACTAPVLAGDLAIYGSVSARVVGFNLKTATTTWAYQMQGLISVPPQLAGTSVFAGDSRGNLVLLTASNGDQVWRAVTFGAVKTASLITAARIYVPCTDMSLYALDRLTGKDKWVYRATEPLPYSPVAAGNAVIQPLPSGQLVGVDAAKGSELWRIHSAPMTMLAVGQNLLLTFHDHLELLDPQTGKILASAPVHGYLQEVLSLPDNSLLLLDRDGWMMRLDPK